MKINTDCYGIGTDNNGVLIFKKTSGKPVWHDEINRRLVNFNLTRVKVIFEDINSNIWIGSREGLVLNNYSLNEFFLIQKSGSTNGLSDNIIFDINQDYNGNKLIGTQEGGLNILSPDQLKANKPGKFIFSKNLPGSEDYGLSHMRGD
jgi:ligand-binding sensor domain-containing protein